MRLQASGPAQTISIYLEMSRNQMLSNRCNIGPATMNPEMVCRGRGWRFEVPRDSKPGVSVTQDFVKGCLVYGPCRAH